jgi:hypothetical protein
MMDRRKGYLKSAAYAAADGVEGGEEIKDSMRVTETLFRPVSDTAQKVKEAQKKKIKKKVRDAVIKKVTKEVPKQTGKKVAKETAKQSAKVTAKVAVGTAATVAGATAGSLAGPAGTLAGLAVGKLAGDLEGEKIDKRFFRMGNRSRVFSFLRTEMADPGGDRGTNFEGNLFKTMGSLVARNILRVIKAVGKWVLKGIILLGSVMMIMVAPFIVILLFLYNSPFSIFLPKLTHTETVQEVTEGYFKTVEDGIREKLEDNEGYYATVFLGVNEMDSEGYATETYDEIEDIEKNLNDVLIIYMVKNGIDDTASEMTERRKKELRKVFEDMVQYAAWDYTYTVELERDILDKDGQPTGEKEKYEVERTVKLVEAYIHTAEEMAEKYGFNEKRMKLLKEMQQLIK